jgi:hypothetical protein
MLFTVSFVIMPTCNNANYRIQVHSTNHPNSIRTFATTPEMPTSDNFKKGDCTPIEYLGRRSVTCKGERTSIIYTPYLPERPFEQLDGRIMLARLLVHWGGHLWMGSKSKPGDQEFTLATDDLMESWQEQLNGVSRLMENLTKGARKGLPGLG